MTVSTLRILAITGAIAVGSAVPAAAQQPQSSGDRASQRTMESQSQRATTGQSGGQQSSAQQVSQQEMQRYVQALMGLASFHPDFAVVTRSGRAAEITLVDRGLTSAEARQELQRAGMTPQEFRRITAAIHQDQQVQQRYRQVLQQQVAQARQQQAGQQQAGQQQMGQTYGTSGGQRGGRPGTAELRPIGTPSGGGGMTSGQQMPRSQMQRQQTQQGAASGRPSDQQLQQYVETRQQIEQQMGWDEFVRVHNQIAADQALQSRVQQQMRQTQSGASGRTTEPRYRAGPPPRQSAPGDRMQPQSGAGQQQGGTSGQQVSPGEGAPLPSGGALSVGPETLSPGQQEPPGTQEPALGPSIPTPTQ